MGGGGDEATQHAVEQRVDQVLFGGEVAVERHGRGVEVGGDGAQGDGVEADVGDVLGGVEDEVAGEGAARTARSRRRRRLTQLCVQRTLRRAY